MGELEDQPPQEHQIEVFPSFTLFTISLYLNTLHLKEDNLDDGRDQTPEAQGQEVFLLISITLTLHLTSGLIQDIDSAGDQEMEVDEGSKVCLMCEVTL
jgi:hypothetical protein